MSNICLAWAWKQPTPSAISKLLLIKLADQANDNGVSWPKQSTLASECGVSRETINRHIQKLVEHDLLMVRQGRRFGMKIHNTYQLNLAKNSPFSVVDIDPSTDDEGAKNGGNSDVTDSHNGQEQEENNGGNSDVIDSHTRCDGQSQPDVTEDHIRCDGRSHQYNRTIKELASNAHARTYEEAYTTASELLGIIGCPFQLNAHALVSQVQEWMELGFNAKQIIDLVRNKCQHGAGKGKRIAWFRAAFLDAVPTKCTHPLGTVEGQRAAVSLYQGDGDWPEAWGPRLDHPDTLVSDSVLAEFGLSRAPASTAIA